MKFDVVTGCPVPRQIAPQVRAIAKRSGASLNSAYRGDKAEGLLRRLGKATQRALWRGWLLRLPGYNPANPPGRSTHELHSDGVAYPGPIGRTLAPWQCGLDWSNSDAALRAARELGYDLFRPYSDGREYHHLNFRTKPKRLFVALRPGDRGKRVKAASDRLRYINDLSGKRYLPALKGTKTQRAKLGRRFGPKLEAAVKRFQRERGLKADGIIGRKTHQKLVAVEKRQRRRRAARAAAKKAKKVVRRKPTHISNAGLDFIIRFEGGQSADGKFRAYYDRLGGVWTIGYGETKGVKAGMVWSAAKARRRLRRRINRDFAPHVRRLGLPGQGMFDAVCSFVYNLGPGAIAPGTGVGRELRAKRYERAANEMLRWDKAGRPPKPVRGLTRRRKAEARKLRRGARRQRKT